MPILDTRAIDDLAIFGGRPAFAQSLHVGRPNIGDREKFSSRVNDILDRRWLTNDGPYVSEFEQRIIAPRLPRRCGAYSRIVAAVSDAAAAMRTRR